MSNYPGTPGPPSWPPPGPPSWQPPGPPSWPPPGPPSWPPPGPPPPGHGGRNRSILLVVAAVIFVVVIIGGYLLFVRGDTAQASEVLLEPVASEGAFPWTGSLVPEGAPTSVPQPPPTGVPTTPDSGRAPLISVPGDRAGIYGGSLELSVCDKRKLISFLLQNPSQAAAWAGVLGVDDISGYIDALASVILGADTRVTNHGFEDGKATPLQSVLQAGTAVLIDNHGVPRVRCQCGNPLLPPVLSTTPNYTGPPWTGFNPGQIIVVQPSTVVITQITVVNVSTGGPLVIPVGGSGPPLPTSTTAVPPRTTPSSTPGSPTPRTTRTVPPTTSKDGSVVPGDIVGYWTGDWGDLVLADAGGGVIVGAYSYDDGVVTGTLVGNTFQGRWCEQPRASDLDRGPVQFTFVTVGGSPQIDGRWLFDADGPAAEWREDWDLTEQSNSAPPPELVARAADSSLRCA